MRLLSRSLWDLSIDRAGLAGAMIGLPGRLCLRCRVLFVDPRIAGIFATYELECLGAIESDRHFAGRLARWRQPR